MGHRVVIIQSNYIPWKGYFDLLSHADTVVLFDNVQSTKNDWRNRNQIKTHGGKAWLTIPVKHSNHLRIREVEVAATNWHEKHWRSVSQSYAKAPHAQHLLPAIREWYREAGEQSRLSGVNRVFLRRISEALGLEAKMVEVGAILSDDEHDALDPNRRLVEICRRLDATSYLSGPAARNYLDEGLFQHASIDVEWFDYNGYPQYPQLHGEFDHAVSVLDVLLMLGPDARDYAIRKNPEFNRMELQLP